ncbi:hypothetical protein BD779DRAFT_1477338 [Infundibulicybe gibba]|nr:hypothetical protein BD779DRAFT_1477338 [Infundibulicybe gibba]
MAPARAIGVTVKPITSRIPTDTSNETAAVAAWSYASRAVTTRGSYMPPARAVAATFKSITSRIPTDTSNDTAAVAVRSYTSRAVTEDELTHSRDFARYEDGSNAVPLTHQGAVPGSKWDSRKMGVRYRECFAHSDMPELCPLQTKIGQASNPWAKFPAPANGGTCHLIACPLAADQARACAVSGTRCCRGFKLEDKAKRGFNFAVKLEESVDDGIT